MNQVNSKIQIRNKLIQKLISEIDKKRILGVSIDPGKEFHQALLFDFNGKILGKSFAFNSFLSGYEKLKKRIDKASKKIKAKKILIGIEKVYTCSENISRHLMDDYENVYFINPSSTAANRTQKLLFGLKTDAIDAASIGDLLIRGECHSYNLPEGLYLELQKKTYWREKKLNLQAKLKNQIIGHMDMIYPGLTSHYEGNRPLFHTAFQSDISRLLLKLLLLPSEIASMQPQTLSKLCLENGFTVKIQKATTIVNYFKKMLLPPDRILPVYREILKRDVDLLRHLEKDIEEIEKSMIELAKKTPARILFNQIKGLSDTLIASYVGCLGDVIKKYKSAKHIYSSAGLSPKLEQSGSNPPKKRGIKRAGSRMLRSILFRAAVFVSKHDSYFKNYFEKIRKNKSGMESYIIISNKLNKIMFAIMKNQTPYSPLPVGKSE